MSYKSKHVEPQAIAVTPPSKHLWSRVVLPGCLLGFAVVLLVMSGRATFRTSTSVEVFPVTGQVALANQRTQSDGDILFQAAGWVEPDPFAVNASVLIPGVVEKINVLEGHVVSKGDELASLIPDDARLDVMRAKAHLAFKRAKKQQALALMEQLHAERVVMEDQLSRLEEAYEKGAATERNVVQQRLKIAAHRKQCDAAAVVADAIADAEIEIASAELATAELALSRTVIRSPIDGVVLERLAEPGMPRSPNMNHTDMGYIVRLYDPTSLQVRVDVPLNEAARIGVGQRAEVIVDVLPGRIFEGEITRLVHQADIQKNTIEVKVKIKNPEKELKPEMLSRVRFKSSPASEKESPQSSIGRQMTLPNRLIDQQTDASGVVLIVDAASQTAQYRMVELGAPVRDGWVTIRSGLQPGDRVIVTQGKEIEAGEAVAIESEWNGEIDL